MKIIHSAKAPKVVGPYSQALEHNGLIFCSGQIGIDPATGELLEGIENQTHRVIKNLKIVLTEAGVSLDNVIKTTIFLADMDHYVTVNEIYGSYFPNYKPTRSTVQVAKLPKAALIEIEMIAVK